LITNPESPSLMLLEQDLVFIDARHRPLAIANALRNPTSDEERFVSIALDLWFILTEHCEAMSYS
jgi:hypothetical protein